jgi:basic amino acid/polyamine antiporter, APA family
VNHESSKSNGLVRELGLSQALAIGLGTMIGAGIFVLSSLAADRAGPAASLSYIAAGLICLPTAMAVSELATGMSQAGGSYHLISRSLGPVAGAVVGPGNWLGLVFATGFYLIGFAEYVDYFVDVPTWATALVAGVFFIFLNYRGAKLSGGVQNIIVVLLVLILALFVVRGLFNVTPVLHDPFVPNGWGAVFATVGLIIVSFTGFEKISTIAEEIKRPERNLPRAIIGSVLVATVLYASILYVATGIIPYDRLAELRAPLVEAANLFMSVVGIVGMSIGALLATASSANAAIMASSRINFAMGRDHVLPSWFNEIHPSYGTPHRSVLVTGVLAILLALSGQAAVLAEISSALFMVSYALLALSVLVMRRAQPSWYRPSFRVPLYPVLPAIGGLLALAVITTMEPVSQIAGLGLVVGSLIWYFAWARRKTPVEGELAPWMERERPLEAVISAAEQAGEASRHEILVPVANPDTAKGLITLAASLAHGRRGTDVVALKVVPVPVSVPLWAAQERLNRKNVADEDILRRAAKHGAVAGVRIEMLLRAAHEVATGIVAVARSRPETRLILLGWRGPLRVDRVRNSVDKEVVRTTRRNVAVMLNRDLDDVRRILIPAGGGPHARLGLRLAYDLVKGEDARLVVFRIVRQKDADLKVEQLAVEKLIRNELGTVDGRVSACVVYSTQIVKRILLEAHQGYDLLVIGASEEWTVHNWLFGAIPDEVAARAPCSVLMVKKYEPSPVSWLRRAVRRFPRL